MLEYRTWLITKDARLQNSRIFCERERRSIFERTVWSESKDGEGERMHTIRQTNQNSRQMHVANAKLGSITSRCSRKEPALLPRTLFSGRNQTNQTGLA